MNADTVHAFIAGPAGAIECKLDEPPAVQRARGVAVVCHPNPQQGGTMDHKVVHTIARACLALGWRTVRFNYRGAGQSGGVWDEGRGEVQDALAVIAHHREPGRPLLLAGFSFGGYVAASAAAALGDAHKAERLVMIGPSTLRQHPPAVPADSIVVHGEADEIVPLSATLDWARPQALPIIVFPGAGHFFHGQQTLLKNVIVQQLRQH